MEYTRYNLIEHREREAEIDELVVEAKRRLNKYSSIDDEKYYVEVLTLQELHQINRWLHKMMR